MDQWREIDVKQYRKKIEQHKVGPIRVKSDRPFVYRLKREGMIKMILSFFF
jgi:hypothetical protein